MTVTALLFHCSEKEQFYSWGDTRALSAQPRAGYLMYPDVSDSPKITLITTLKETIQFPNVNSNNIQRDHYCFQAPSEK